MSPRVSNDPVPDGTEPEHPTSLELDDYLDEPDSDPAL
ncbi:hypothetical protein C8E83_3836 [Frondihabitans australicus]|uniref:Uncharacterized protein n=1 Tax=Frondihabitans australicus TaxID=386892 RepID=A0A495ILL7_9MICO|nr:hypothetical protein C8E83_3836 [Frondihabitans australicus]